MIEGDKITVKIKKSSSGSFFIIMRQEWLKYLGFSQDKLSKDEICLSLKAEDGLKFQKRGGNDKRIL